MINTPEEEAEVKLETIRNRITLSEGEFKRLEDLKKSQEYAISELVKEKKYHEEEVVRLENKQSELEDALIEISEDHTEALKVIQDAKTVLAEQQAEWQKLEQAKHDHEAEKVQHRQDVEAHLKTVDKTTAYIENEKDELAKREDAVRARENQIKEFAKTLQGK